MKKIDIATIEAALRGESSMSKLTGAVMLSLDGIMQAPGGPEEDPSHKFDLGGWVFPFWDESGDAQFDKFLVEPDYDLLLGKRTYDIFAAYWPYNVDNPIGEQIPAHQ